MLRLTLRIRDHDMALYYNGINFIDVNTTTHVMGPMKDPSGSDQLFTRIDIKARTLLNISYLPSTILDFGKDAGGILARVRHYLTQPRCPMYYDLQSTTRAQAFASGNDRSAIINIPDGRDDAGGPWPDPTAITVAYTTPNTLEIYWACTVQVKDCETDSSNESSILTTSQNPISLRWEDSLSWDETWKATYTRSGTCIISSRQRRTMDWFRRNRLNMTVCAGFRRTNAKYLVSKDGLRCDFNFTDVQIRFAPPYPSVKMTINQSETAPTQGGMKKGAVAVEMTGIQNANVVDLSRWALLILKARVFASNPVMFQGVVPGIMNLETTETQDDVTVRATCSYKVNPGNQRNTGVISTAKKWGSYVGKSLVLGPVGAGLSALIKPPQKTQQNKTPVGESPWPWVGYGTSPTTLNNPIGWATWANPYASISGPDSGLGMAEAVSLFVAVLNDPCGNTALPVPNPLDTPPTVVIPSSTVTGDQSPSVTPPAPGGTLPSSGLGNNSLSGPGRPSASNAGN